MKSNKDVEERLRDLERDIRPLASLAGRNFCDFYLLPQIQSLHDLVRDGYSLSVQALRAQNELRVCYTQTPTLDLLARNPEEAGSGTFTFTILLEAERYV